MLLKKKPLECVVGDHEWVRNEHPGYNWKSKTHTIASSSVFGYLVHIPLICIKCHTRAVTKEGVDSRMKNSKIDIELRINLRPNMVYIDGE